MAIFAIKHPDRAFYCAHKIDTPGFVGRRIIVYRVVKRENSIAEFDIRKTSEAIIKAFEATERQYNNSIIDLLALKVTADFEPKIKDGLIAVEDIQDSVEEVLSQAGYADVAKAYILYRKQREKLRNMKSPILDYRETVNN